MRDGLNLQHNSTPATIQALGNSFRDGAPLFDFESSLTARSITAIRACRKGTGVLACWRAGVAWRTVSTGGIEIHKVPRLFGRKNADGSGSSLKG